MLIPQVREELLKIADGLEHFNQPGAAILNGSLRLTEIIGHLRDLEKELYRRVTKKGRRTHEKITDAIRGAVLSDHKECPELSYHELAALHNISPGRVSEIINGKRK